MPWKPDERGFKINNSWAAYCARDLVAEFPDLRPLIQLRYVEGDEEREGVNTP